MMISTAVSSLHACTLVALASAHAAADAMMIPTRQLRSKFLDKGSWAHPVQAVADDAHQPTGDGITKEEFCANNLTGLEIHMAETETALGITTNKTTMVANETWTVPPSYACSCNGISNEQDGSSTSSSSSTFVVDCSIRHEFLLQSCVQWLDGVAPVDQLEAAARGSDRRRRRLGFFDTISDVVDTVGNAASSAGDAVSSAVGGVQDFFDGGSSAGNAVSNAVSDAVEGVQDFFDGGDGNNDESTSNEFRCVQSEDHQVNQVIEEKIEFTLNDDDVIYHLTQLSWSTSDDDSVLPPVDQTVTYEDGNAIGCTFNNCSCTICDDDKMTFGLDCTEDDGEIVECGSDRDEAVKDIGPYSRTFDFGVIVKTPEESETNSNGLVSMQGICDDLSGLEEHMNQMSKTNLEKEGKGMDVSIEYPRFECACSELSQADDDASFAVDCSGQIKADGIVGVLEEQMVFRLKDGAYKLVQTSSGNGGADETFPHDKVFSFGEDGSGKLSSCSLLGCSSCSICDDTDSFAFDCTDREYTFCTHAEEGVGPLDLVNCKSTVTEQGKIDLGTMSMTFADDKSSTKCGDADVQTVQTGPYANSYDFGAAMMTAGKQAEAEASSGNSHRRMSVLVTLAYLTLFARSMH